jgi:two-component system chemotaxis response regulator CheB
MKEIKVLILDDSMVMREMLHMELERDINVKVVAKCSNPFDARDNIIRHKPDILITDINMDKMDGISFIEKLLPQYYLPIIVISGDMSREMEARRAGAAGFLQKPVHSSAEQLEGFFSNLHILIKSVFCKNDMPLSVMRSLSAKPIAIGASTGGAEAIEALLGALPPVMPPIVLAQHMPPKFTNTFAVRLNAIAQLSVKEAEYGDILIPGQAYIAPGGFHTLIKKRENRFVIAVCENTAGIKTCPNIDLLFE